MKPSNQTEAREIAQERGFQVKEITYGMNGYPSNLGDYAVTGFETFEAAETFAEEVGGVVSHFETKDGWHFWKNGGQAYGPYSSDNYLSDLGDNYWTESDEDAVKERMKDVIKDMIDGECDFRAIKEYLDSQQEIMWAISNATEDEVVISNGRSCEVVEKTNMGYHVDATRCAIGVLLSRDKDEEE